jgi:hypothetical protein
VSCSEAKMMAIYGDLIPHFILQNFRISATLQLWDVRIELEDASSI